MATDLTVRFTGDTAGLNAAATAARQTLGQFAPAATTAARVSLEALAAAMLSNSDAAKKATDGWRENVGVLADLTTIARGAAEAIGAIAAASVAVGTTAFSVTTTAIRGVNSALDETEGSLERYAVSSAYAERSSRLFEQAQTGLFAAVGRGIVGVERWIEVQELAFTSTAHMEIAAIGAAGALQKFDDALSNAGVGMKSTLDDFTAQIMQIPGTSREAAMSIEEMLATIPNYSVEANTYLVAMIQTMSKTSDEAVANAKKITSAFTDNANGGSIMGSMVVASLHDLDDIQDAVAKLSRSMNPAQASQFFDAVSKGLRLASANMKTETDQNVASLQKIPLVGNLLVRTIQDQIDKQKEFAASVTVATANLELQKAAADKVAQAIQQQDNYEKLLNEDTSRAAQLDQIGKNIQTLQGRQNKDVAAPSGDVMDRLARTLIGEAGGEGQLPMEAVAGVIQNRAVSGYMGAQSYADVINAPKQFSVWNPGNPAGATANSTPTNSPVYQQAMAIVQKMVAGNLDDPTNGATSYYAPKSTNVAAEPWVNTLTNKSQFGSQIFGNTPNSPPVNSDQANDANIQRLQEQIDLRNKLTAAQEGGTAAEREQLQITQQNAQGMHDEVAQAQAMLDAKKKDLASAQGGSPETVRAAEEAVAQAQITLSNKVAAVEKADNDLKVAQAQEGSKAKLDAQLAAYGAEEARAGGNAAKIAEIERQKVEAIKAYNQQQAADAVATEAAKFDAAQRNFRLQQDQIKETAQQGQISRDQEMAQLATSLSQQEAATRAHYATLTAIQKQYGTDTAQAVRQSALQQDEALNKLDQQRLASTRQINAEIEQGYKSSFEQIGSTVSSTIMQMIQRQATLRDLARSVVLDIVQQFIQARVKMVADWAAGQVAKVASTVAAETAQTSATATGTAARTSLIGAASVQQQALVGIGVIKSILASAAEAFAGIFGFLSPIMGPAAVGLAAAGQATVAASAAAASFDVGSWSLPSSGLAMVHAGEMIVPASQTPWAQSLMAAGGPRGGLTTMGDMHFHINGAQRPQDIADEIAKHARRIGRALNTRRP